MHKVAVASIHPLWANSFLFWSIELAFFGDSLPDLTVFVWEDEVLSLVHKAHPTRARMWCIKRSWKLQFLKQPLEAGFKIWPSPIDYQSKMTTKSQRKRHKVILVLSFYLGHWSWKWRHTRVDSVPVAVVRKTGIQFSLEYNTNTFFPPPVKNTAVAHSWIHPGLVSVRLI